MQRILVLIGVVASLAACGDRGLRDLGQSSDGPDEFSVLPSAPLTIPDDLSRLPPPTPGGVNPVDANPRAEAIVALGGNPAAAFAGGIPASDGALVAHAGRNGTTADIRALLANEDAAFRAAAGRFGGLFSRGDRYFSAYARQSLDAYSALGQLRAAGVTTPSAPPAPQ